MDLSSCFSIRSSESINLKLISSAKILPTVVFPEPIMPIKIMDDLFTYVTFY